MLIIAGLGNPGNKYLKTRHNAGFIVLDQIFNKYKQILTYEKYQSYCAEIKIRRHGVLLIKPYTYMNLSGEAVKRAVNVSKILEINKNLIVIHDDVDIEFGKIKVKNKGGDAGHNGIKSISENLATENYIRIRIGVGRPENSYVTPDYVLDDFTNSEYDYLINDVSKKIINFISQYLEIGYSKSKSICEI